jgi:hypothetical protein
MTWVKFTDRKPRTGVYEDGKYLITRFPGQLVGSSCFESWNNWNNNHLRISNHEGGQQITHWWDGESDVDLALAAWTD